MVFLGIFKDLEYIFLVWEYTCIYFSLPILKPSRLQTGDSVSDVAFLLLQSDFNGLPMGTFQAFPNIHPPQIPATPPSYESVSA